MALMEWNDRLSVKIREIDDQHRTLVNMVNKLHDAMKEGHADDIVMPIVAEMKQYAAIHFATEEKYFKLHNYPEYAKHKAEHDAFVAKVVQVESDLKSGKCAMSMDILNFLSQWLVNHIKGTDKKYSAFLNQAGVH